MPTQQQQIPKDDMIYKIYTTCPHHWIRWQDACIYIWNILDWIENWKSNSDKHFIRDNQDWVLQFWKYTSAPIEEQPEECINFIYSLIS